MKAKVPSNAKIDFWEDHRTNSINVVATLFDTYVVCDGRTVGRFSKEINGRLITLSRTKPLPLRAYKPEDGFPNFEIESKVYEIKMFTEGSYGVHKRFRAIEVTAEEWEELFDRDDIIPEE